jgi:predicted HD superfamily hydrolase involved in NAD metabolism
MKSQNILEETDYIWLETAVLSRLSEARVIHSAAAAAVSSRLAFRFGLNELYARICAIWHDAARETHPDAILRTVLDDGRFIPEQVELEQPMLLHGAAAAIELAEIIPGVPLEILYAVRWHTLGSPAMGSLGYVLYIADYIEEGRSHISAEEKVRIEQLPRLEDMMLTILEGSLTYLAEKRKKVARSTEELRRMLERESIP